MSDSNLNILINDLAGDLKPAKTLRHPLTRLLPFIAIALAYVILFVSFMNIRIDISQKLSDIAFLSEIALVGFITITAGIASAYLSVPDMRGQKGLIAMPLAGLAVFTGWAFFRAIQPEAYMPALEIDHCMVEGALMTLMPATALLFFIRKGATTHPKLSALMNILFAGGLGYIGLRFVCVIDSIGHLVVSHVGPYVLIGAIMGIGAKKLYKW